MAEPVDDGDLTSPWITGRARAVKALKANVIGPSDYEAHEGVNTGGANGIYWVDIIAGRPDGLVVVSNITEGARREVESIQTVLEPDLLYPLLRGRDVGRWRGTPSASILAPQSPSRPERGYPESEMAVSLPKTYAYLVRFQEQLSSRPAFIKYLESTGAPFYALYDIKTYTFTPHKVVWREQASSLTAAVVEPVRERPVLPDHKLMLVPVESPKEAYYLAAALNSSPAQLVVASYAVETQMGRHVLHNVRVPKFTATDALHRPLSELSQQAHEAAAVGRQDEVQDIEAQIDELAAELWGLTKAELKEIQQSLAELRG